MAKQIQNNAQEPDGTQPSGLLEDLMDEVSILEGTVSDEEILGAVKAVLEDDIATEQEQVDVIEYEAFSIEPETPEVTEPNVTKLETPEIPEIKNYAYKCTGSAVLHDRRYNVGEFIYNLPDDAARSLIQVGAIELVEV
jgi:hypothetical protein